MLNRWMMLLRSIAEKNLIKQVSTLCGISAKEDMQTLSVRHVARSTDWQQSMAMMKTRLKVVETPKQGGISHCEKCGAFGKYQARERKIEENLTVYKADSYKDVFQ